MAINKDIQKETIDVAFAYLIARSARLLRYSFIKEFRQHGYELTPEQWFIITKLNEQDGLTQVELTDDIFNDKPNITRILDSMEKKKLVERRRSDSDRRSFNIFLTGHAKKLLPKLWAFARQEREIVYSGLTKKDFSALEKIVTKIEVNILKR